MTLLDTVQGLVGGDDSGEDWIARLRPDLKLVSPNGTEYIAKWIGNPRTKGGKVVEFNYPGIRGTVPYDQLPESDRYSLTIYFDGRNWDKTAADFFEKCNERGTWDMVHPVYGFKVVQFTSIRDNCEPVRNGYASFDIESFEPIDPATLKTQTDLRSAIGAKLDDFNVQAASQFSKVTSGTFAAVAAISSTTNKIVTATDTILGPIARSNDSINRIFLATQRGIQDTLDAVILKPIQLAGQMQELIQLPALAIQDIQSRLKAYADLAARTFGIDSTADAEGYNTALTKELALSAMLGANATIAGTSREALQNRSQALEFAQTLSGELATITNHLDDDQKKFKDLPIDQQYFSQSDAYTEALTITGLGIQQFLITAFDLAVEKRFILDRYKTPVQIAVEEYGTLGINDENVDLVISTNKLAGNDVLLLPPGREVVVYV